MIVRE